MFLYFRLLYFFSVYHIVHITSSRQQAHYSAHISYSRDAATHSKDTSRNNRTKDSEIRKFFMIILFRNIHQHSAPTQPISMILEILLPIILAIARSVCHCRAALMLINNSGAEVHIATIVRPVTKGEIHSLLAIPLAPSTKRSAYLYNS